MSLKARDLQNVRENTLHGTRKGLLRMERVRREDLQKIQINKLIERTKLTKLF